MSLGENLDGVLKQIEGSSGIAVVGMDGIIVEERKSDSNLDLQAVGAEFSTLIRGADQAVSSVGSALLELSITCPERVFLLTKINGDYFLILVLSSEKSLGKGRFLLRRAVSGLIEEMA